MQKGPGASIAKDIASAIRREFSDATIILFGSRALGRELKESDIDLIVVTDSFRNLEFVNRPAIVLRILRAARIRVPVGLDLLCYTREEFERKKHEIGTVAEALSYGIML